MNNEKAKNDFIRWAENFSKGSRLLLKELNGLSDEHKIVISMWFKEIEIRSNNLQK